MKKAIYALLALFLLQLPVSAQQGDTRTTITKIADLLALQPAETSERLREALSQIEKFTAADISALFQQLTPPGTGNNAGIEYAANSYSYHVLLPGKGTQRATFVQGAIDALGKIDHRDNKGFVIQMLQNSGDDTAVDALQPYLSDEYLSEKAARALARIGTESAAQALLQRLPEATGLAEINMINALGFIGYGPAEQAILAKVGATDAGLRKTILYALSEIAGMESSSVLADAAKAVGYVYDPTEATAAYLNYAHRLIEKGESTQALKIASKLVKETKQADQVHTHIAALGLLTEINRTKQVKALLKASRDNDPVYRNAALALMIPYLTDQTSSQLTRRLAKTDEQVQVDILHYLGDHKQMAALSEVQRALQANSSSVRVAAIRALHQLEGAQADQTLIGLLSESDADTREAIKQVLLTSKNEGLTQLITSALETERNADIQILLIAVLAQRGAEASVPTLLGIIDSDAPQEVKAAAFDALPHVARSVDLAKLLDLLTSAKGEYATAIQAAAVSAIQLSDDQPAQIRTVISRMQAADAAQQPHFFPILSGVGGAEALSVTVAHANHDDPTLRSAATAALTSWTDSEALPHLVTLSRKKVMDSGQMNAVINGLVRLVGIAGLPAEQKVLYLRDAFDAAETTEQKKLILRALEANKTYNALMFAGKYLDDDALQSVAANVVMNIALDNKDLYGSDVNLLLNRVVGLLSGSESSYLREAIQKHLDELPKGPGYTPLFNGKDLTGWKGLVADPIKRGAMDAKTLAEEQAKADEVMREGWSVSNGELVFNGKGDNIATVKQYGDFEMLVDWKLAKDGKDGDAGIYLRGTPQVQIWDTSRVDAGAQVGSGGLYNNQVHESKPLKVADNPLGEWNTFRIIMVGDRVTVYLNGELVTDNVVLENYWDRSLPIFPREQIELQAHGTVVSYRDIYIRELPRKEVFTLPDTEKQEGFEVLFDGTNLDAWTGNTDSYGISDEGTLTINPSEGSGGNLYTKKEFADFVYRFEFRLTPGANNGIGIRAPLEGDAAYTGMEIQVLDDGAEMYKDLAEYQYHGSVYGVIPAKRGFLRPVGEWNEEEIYIKGNQVRITLNGTVIVDGDLEEASRNGTLDGKQHPGLVRKSGHIAFLGHGSEVHFRNIRIKRL